MASRGQVALVPVFVFPNCYKIKRRNKILIISNLFLLSLTTNRKDGIYDRAGSGSCKIK